MWLRVFGLFFQGYVTTRFVQWFGASSDLVFGFRARPEPRESEIRGSWGVRKFDQCFSLLCGNVSRARACRLICLLRNRPFKTG